MLSVKQEGIKYHFLSLWEDLTWDWTPVSLTIGKHSTHFVLVYLIVLILKTQGLIAIAKIVFFHKQTNICWFKYELRGFYDFTLRNIASSKYHIYRKWKKGISLQQKQWLTKKK